MNAYATERKAFGAPIRSFGQIQRYIADSYAECVPRIRLRLSRVGCPYDIPVCVT